MTPSAPMASRNVANLAAAYFPELQMCGDWGILERRRGQVNSRLAINRVA
jgi:hypothetical protein